MVPSLCRAQNKVSPGRCRTPLLGRIPCCPHGSSHDLCTPRRASGEPWLACHLQTGFAVDFQRSGAHVPGALGSHSSVLLRLAKKPIHTGEGAAVPGDRAGIEVSELRADRAAVLSAGATFAHFIFDLVSGAWLVDQSIPR